MYAVVLFEEKDELAVVPESWILSQGKVCLWPKKGKGKALKVTKLVRSLAEPADDWEEHDITLLKDKIATYEKAQEKCNRFLVRLTTDAESEYESGKRKRTKTSRYEPESDEETLKQSKRKKGKENVDKNNSSTELPLLPIFPDSPSLAVESVRSTRPSLTSPGTTDQTLLPSQGILTEQASTGTPEKENSSLSSPGTSGTQHTLASQGSSNQSMMAPPGSSNRSVLASLGSSNRSAMASPGSSNRSGMASPGSSNRSGMASPGSSNRTVLASSTTDRHYLSQDRDIDMPSDRQERDRLFFSTLLEIKGMVRNNSIALNRMVQKLDGSQHGQALEDIDDFNFPMQSIEDVTAVEQLLQEKSRKKALVSPSS